MLFCLNLINSRKSQVTPRSVGDCRRDEHQQFYVSLVASSVNSVIVSLTQLKITNVNRVVWINICCKTSRFYIRIRNSHAVRQKNSQFSKISFVLFHILLVSIKMKTFYLLHPYGISKILTSSDQGQVKLYCFCLNHSHLTWEPFSN